MFESGQLTVLNINDILPNRFQPRIRFDEEKLEELAESIGKYGVIQPIVVRPVSNKYEIIAGERRYKASKLANKSTIPAIIVNLSDKDSEEIALLENIQRQQLSPIEEAVSYKRILDMGYITQEGLAKKLGKSQSTIANKIRLLNLDDEVQSYLLNNKISERHARSLLRIPNKEEQVKMLHRIVEERLTVKQTDKEIEKLRENMKIENNEVRPVAINKNENQANIESLFDEFEKTESNKGVKNTMDIEKIMREAKDINVPEEKPKDISGLMQQKNDVQSEPIVREETTFTPVNNLEPGKFISVTPEAPVQETVKQESPVNNGVTFDSMFNQPVQIEPTQVSSQTTSSMPVNNVLPNAQLNSENNVKNEISEDTKKVISTAVADALRKFNERKANNNQSVQENNVSLADNPNVSSEVSSVQDSGNFKPISSESVENINQINNNLNVNSIPSTDIIADNALNDYAINNTSMVTPQTSMASNIAQNVKPVNSQAHFAQIVKLLRECADKIEQNGYFVSVDEMDLGNQYKVTFTIDKE